MKHLLTTSAAAVIMGASAITGATAADSAPPMDPAPVAAFSWSGPYIGGHAGYAWGDAAWDFEGGFFSGGPSSTFDDDPDGFFGGGQIGYNHQFGAWVAGLEATVSGAGIEETSASPFFPDQDTLETRINLFATLTGRFGWAWDRWLIYGKAGFAWGRIKVLADSTSGGGVTARSTKTHTGWTAGAGIEYLATENIVVGIEYSHLDFGSRRHSTTDSDGDPFEVDVDAQLDTVAARLGYKF